MTRSSTLGVSIPCHVSEFIFVKIDHLALINEHELANGILFYETELSGPLNQNDLDLVRSIAVKIIKAAVAAHVDQITQQIQDIIITHSVNWPVKMHHHVINDW